MKGEPEVGASVLDGPRPILVPEHRNRVTPNLCQKVTLQPQIGQAAGERFLAWSVHIGIVDPNDEFVKLSLGKHGWRAIGWRPVTDTHSLSAAKRRIVDVLKRRSLTGPELAERFEVSPEAIRQHLADLANNGLIRSAPRSTNGPGRPPVEWSLTDVAIELFPDRHADLTVSLIEAIRSAVGDDGLDAVVAERTAEQLASYHDRLADVAADNRIDALAAIRSEEGYMAEVVDDPDGDGRLLIEHHCPICEAATACQGLCRAELDLFRASLGQSMSITREQHLLTGDDRCVYRIRPTKG
jgi:predicted ArsR family transcriptional regulator